LAATACGCGKTQAPATSIAASEGSVTAGEAALKSGDFKLADKEFSSALNRGSLLPDLVEKAKLGQVRARIGLGDYSGAEAGLKSLETEAAELDQVWVVRGELCLKQGDMPAASVAYQRARELNPDIVLPDALK
jgi:predicted negative regulator of RcsB-dependent stress response